MGGGGILKGVGIGVEKQQQHMKASKMKIWLIRATTSVLLWTCIVQLTAIGETWTPRVLNVWPPCFNSNSASSVVHDALPSLPPRLLPPKSASHPFRNLFFYLLI